MTEEEARDIVYSGKPFPTLGDPALTWTVQLTEPEINAIHAAMGFMRSACAEFPPLKRYWSHYGPTLEALSERLFQQSEGGK